MFLQVSKTRFLKALNIIYWFNIESYVTYVPHQNLSCPFNQFLNLSVSMTPLPSPFLVNFPLDYPVNMPLYISIITTQPSPTHPSPPSEMRGKVWTVKRVFISTNCSYFSNLPSPTPFFKNLFSYCNYCLLTLVSFFITRGLQNNLNNCIE